MSVSSLAILGCLGRKYLLSRWRWALSNSTSFWAEWRSVAASMEEEFGLLSDSESMPDRIGLAGLDPILVEVR